MEILLIKITCQLYVSIALFNSGQIELVPAHKA